MKNYVDKLLHKKFMHTSYMYNFVTFQQKKWEWFFPQKEIMLKSYVSWNIIYKSYVHNFATF